MKYEKPELVLVDAASIVVLGGIDGVLDGAGTPPDERLFEGLVLGLDE